VGSTSDALLCAEVAELVADMLGVPAVSVDQDANLIEQGLDSIRMMALAGAWRRQGIEVDFAGLAAAPSIRAWANMLGSADVELANPPPAGISATREVQPFPLAPMQHALWIGRQDNQLLGGVSAHLYVEFDGGRVDPTRLRWAATRLAERHPMLRVQFLPDGTQCIREPAAFPVNVEDLSENDGAVAESRLAAIRDAKSHQQLDDGVLELSLTLLPGDRSRLHVDLDMQAADAMSYRTLLDDLAALYGGRALPELRYTYRDYLANIEQVRRSAHERDRHWWSERISELPQPPSLPLSALLGATGKTSGNGRGTDRADMRRSTRRWHWLDPAARDRLYDSAHRRGLTPAMVLAASFANAVAGWSADPHFLLNVPLFGRESLHRDVPKLVGDFTTSLLLDVNLANADTAAQRASVLQKQMHTAAGHAAYPGLSVLRDLSRRRDVQVLVPVVFTSALGLGELFSTDVTSQFGHPVWMISQGPQVLLDAQVTEFDGGVLINWDVREHMFAPGVIDAMFAHHIDEVRQLAAGDARWDQPNTPLVPAAQQSVRDKANSVLAQRNPETLYSGFVANAAHQPDAPAVLSSAGEWTYAQLLIRARSVAAALQARGMQPGDTVGVVGPKCAEQIPALLGTLMAGGVYLPIGVDQPADRARQILQSGQVRHALMCGSQRYDLAVPTLALSDAMVSGGELVFADVATDPEALAYVLFTSGSTGEPKGVEVSHAAAMNTVESLNDQFGIGPSDRCLALSALECDMSVLDIFGTLAAGGAIVVVEEVDRRNPDQWVRLVETHGVTVLNFLPGWLEMLVDVARSGELSSLRVVPTGGDWILPALVRRLRAASPRLRIAGLGGATETAVHGTVCEVAELPEHWTAVPYGVPLPNNACRVVNSQGADCPDWVPGELWIGGRGVARGYRGQSDLSAQRFVQYNGMTWYRTGDLARYQSDGTLEFVGRVDNRVKISGYRVELGDVEVALRRVPGVVAAVAACVAAGNGEQLGAAVVTGSGLTSPDNLRSAVAQLVPEHMVPRRITLVEKIPYTAGGKIDRDSVARLLEEQITPTGLARSPATPLERVLTDIVIELLHKPDLGIDDDFFTSGGDSVSATTAVSRIRTWLDDPPLMVADIFATRTISALADLLRDRDPLLEQVAEVALEVSAMDIAELGAAVIDSGAAQIPQRISPLSFSPWIRRFTASTSISPAMPSDAGHEPRPQTGDGIGTIVVFPHAGGDAATYRRLATAFAAAGSEVFVMQYPQHPGRFSEPAAQTIAELAEGLFDAGPWENLGPIQLFGHCMGSVVAFEFAKIAERHGVVISTLWVSGGAAPSALADLPPLPASDDAVLADITELGGTDSRLLEDPEFLDLLIPAVRADYVALNQYSAARNDVITADITAISGCGDERIGIDSLRQWALHTSGRYTLHSLDGGHFFLFDHVDAVRRLVHTHV